MQEFTRENQSANLQLPINRFISAILWEPKTRNMESRLRELFEQFQSQFGTEIPSHGSGYALMRVPGVSNAFLKALFRASSLLYKSNPWIRYKPDNVFGIRVGKDTDWTSSTQVFSCFQFTNDNPTEYGFNAFRSVKDLNILSNGFVGSQKYLKSAPHEGFMRLVFKPESETNPAYKKMVKELGIESSVFAPNNLIPVIDLVYSNHDGGLPMSRNPDLEELRWLYACVRAILQVHPLVINNDGSFEEYVESVDVQWPADVPKAWEIVSVTVSLPPKKHHPIAFRKTIEEDYDSRENNAEVILPYGDGFVRECAMCGDSVQSNTASRCSRCKAVIYCGAQCQKKHWKDSHRSSCELYKVIMDREEELEFKVFMFSCYIDSPCKWLESVGLHKKGMWRKLCKCTSDISRIGNPWGLEESKCPSRNFHDQSFNSLVSISGWVEYYDMRNLPLTSPVAVLLSFPLTLYHILSVLSISAKNLLAKGREVVVHYLGPDKELDWMPAFSEISYLLGGCGNLHVFMVGPEVPNALSGTNLDAGAKVQVSLIKGLYQDEASYLPPPQVIVALNAGLDESSNYSNWIGALEVIKSQGLTCYFTEESELCCSNAKQILRSAGLSISYPVTPNPFRSPLRIQYASNNLPAFSNGFVFGVNS